MKESCEVDEGQNTSAILFRTRHRNEELLTRRRNILGKPGTICKGAGAGGSITSCNILKVHNVVEYYK